MASILLPLLKILIIFPSQHYKVFRKVFTPERILFTIAGINNKTTKYPHSFGPMKKKTLWLDFLVIIREEIPMSKFETYSGIGLTTAVNQK